MWEWFIAVECLSLMIMMTRWSRLYVGGYYKRNDTPDANSAFGAHLGMGLVPIIAISYLIGAQLAARDLKLKAREKELASIDQDIKQLTG